MCGPIKGSVGATTVIASMLFGTISGSSVATVSAIGSMMLPEMLRAGYKRDYSIGLIAASGFLGILIPPSIPGLVYALSANLSIADVWISTMGPGLLLTLVYVVYNRLFFAKHEQAEVHEGKDNSYFGVISKTPPARSGGRFDAGHHFRQHLRRGADTDRSRSAWPSRTAWLRAGSSSRWYSRKSPGRLFFKSSGKPP